MGIHKIVLQPASRPRPGKSRRNTLLISFLALLAMLLFFVYIIVFVSAGLAAYYSPGNHMLASKSHLGLFQSNVVVEDPFKGFPVLAGDGKQDTFYSFSKAMLSKRVVWVRNPINEEAETVEQQFNQSAVVEEEWDERVVELLGGVQRKYKDQKETKPVVRSKLETVKQLPFVKISLSRLTNLDKAGKKNRANQQESRLNRRKRETTRSKQVSQLKQKTSGLSGGCSTRVKVSKNVLSSKSTSKEGDGAFPDDIFTLEQRLKGAILLHFAGLVYMFVALAIVCDEFFVPALDVITEAMSISDDIAGATLMAAGGSAPEFFTSLFGVFIAENNVGIGTIVGSATFNILCVLAFCTLFSKAALKLTWWPLFRDVFFYVLALLLLVAFFVDEQIEWHEAMAMFILYLIYAIFMKYNSSIQKNVKRRLKRKGNKVSPNLQINGYCYGLNEPGRSSTTSFVSYATSISDSRTEQCKSIPVLHSGAIFRTGIIQVALDPNLLLESGHPVAPLNEIVGNSKNFTNGHSTREQSSAPQCFQTQPGQTTLKSRSSLSPSMHSATSQFGVNSVNMSSSVNADSSARIGSSGMLDENSGVAETPAPPQINNNSNSVGSKPELENPVDISWPRNSFYKQCVYVAIAPIMISLFYSLPDVKKPGRKKYAIVSFFGSVLWIALFSYLMVWLANTIGMTLGISTEVMGLTILAAGTSIPDLITSVIVSRKGLGDMAVSSSIGSNLFDICIGLPIPWLLYFAVTTVRQGHLPSSIRVESNGLICSVTLLFFMLVVLVVSIGLARWEMNKMFGGAMLVSYVFFCSISVLIEKDILVCPLRVHCGV